MPQAPADLDLPPGRRGGAAAGHDRHRAHVFPQDLAVAHAAVGEAERERDQHQVAGPHALHGVAPRAEDRHHLAVLRRVQHRPRQAGGAAAGLQDERHRIRPAGRDPHEIAERRMRLDALADVLDRVGRNLRQVVEALDVARLHAGGAPMALEERDFPAAPHGLQEAPFLQRAQLVARGAEHAAEEVGRRRIVARDTREIERVLVPGKLDLL